MAGPIITVDGLVWFTGSGDVVLTSAGKQAADTEPDRLLAALRLAVEYSANDFVMEAGQGHGPLADAPDMEFEEFLVSLDEAVSHIRQTAGARTAKVTALKARRSQFGANRAALVLKMLATGASYRCVHPGCDVVDNLTVDHKVPVVLGGTDDIENLQFMCLPHNAAKGSRI